MTTAFYHDERCLWHTIGDHALRIPVGRFLQPLAGAVHAKDRETKRRFKNLLKVSYLWKRPDMRDAPMVTMTDILQVHAADYLAKFKAISNTGVGNAGHYPPFGQGWHEIARSRRGWSNAGWVTC